MKVEEITYRPIGIIHSPFKTRVDTPIQPIGATGVNAEVEIFPEYVEGLQDLMGFSHIILLYHCHLCKAYKLRVKPFLDDVQHGVFATRAPARPNQIGISVVRLIKIDNKTLYIQDIDIIDQTHSFQKRRIIPSPHSGINKIGAVQGSLR